MTKKTSKSAKKTVAKKSTAKKTAPRNQNSKGFTDEERAAMQERAREVKAESRRGSRKGKGKADGESDLLTKIADMPEADRAIAERLHAIVKGRDAGDQPLAGGELRSEPARPDRRNVRKFASAGMTEDPREGVRQGGRPRGRR